MKRRFNTSDLRFLAALLIVHAVFFVIAVHYKNIFNGDSAEYIYMALNIRDHFWFYSGNPAMPEVTELLTLRPPGYSLFLLLVYIFSINNWLVLVLQNILSVCNIYYLRSALAPLNYRKRYDWLLLAFVVIYPSQFINANTIAPDILLQSFVLLYFCQFLMLIQKKDWTHGLYMSLALIAGLLIKPVLYPFAYVHCILMLWVAMRFKSTVMPYLAAILPLMVVMLYGAWNLKRTGKLHFTSTQSFNAIFYQYKFIEDKYGNDSALVFLKEERKQADAMEHFYERYDYAGNRSRELLLQNIGPYILFHAKMSLWILIAPGKGELDMFLGNLSLRKLYAKHQPRSLLNSVKHDGIKGLQMYANVNPSFPVTIVVLCFNILKIAGLAIFFMTKSINKYVRIFTAILIAYFIFTAGPIANTRYFIPVSLITAVCATIAYQDILWKYKNKAIPEADADFE